MIPVELPAPNVEETPIHGSIILYFLLGAIVVTFAIRYLHGTFRKSAPALTDLVIAKSITVVFIALVPLLMYGRFLFGYLPFGFGSRSSPFMLGALPNVTSIADLVWRNPRIMKNFAPSNLYRCGVGILCYSCWIFAFIAIDLPKSTWYFSKLVLALIIRGPVPIDLIFIGLTMGFLLTLAYYLSQAPKRDITLWETVIKADDAAKRSNKKAEKKLRKMRILRRKSNGRRRVALEVLEQRQREKITAIRKDFDELVRKTDQQLWNEHMERCKAVVKHDRASAQNDNLRNQLDELQSSSDSIIAELKKQSYNLGVHNWKLETDATKRELTIKELETKIQRGIIETEGAKSSQSQYVKDWQLTRLNLLDVLDGSDPDCAKVDKVRGMLMLISKYDRYTSVDTAYKALKRHEAEMDPRAEEIADRVREAKRLDRGRVFVRGYLKGYEKGKKKTSRGGAEAEAGSHKPEGKSKAQGRVHPSMAKFWMT
ncbi:hypothetical protein G7Y79_00001g004130 [Physcia stellaris]|nr:hypothetical protein G7Y79_00001g004130 [Physcia stellaris]